MRRAGKILELFTKRCYDKDAEKGLIPSAYIQLLIWRRNNEYKSTRAAESADQQGILFRIALSGFFQVV